MNHHISLCLPKTPPLPRLGTSGVDSETVEDEDTVTFCDTTGSCSVSGGACEEKESSLTGAASSCTSTGSGAAVVDNLPFNGLPTIGPPPGRFLANGRRFSPPEN